jgi:hypothetical protein
MKDLVTILPDYDEKVGNMNAKVLATRDAEQASYAHYMAKMLSVAEAQREENKKLAKIRQERHGIDPNAQAPSMLAILARPKEDDEKHFFRPLPKEVVAASYSLSAAVTAGDDQAVGHLVAERPITLEEVAHVENIRRRSKNTLGQSEKSGSGEEAKKAAVNAYLCSPGIVFKDLSPGDQSRIRKPIPYESEPLIAKKPAPAPKDDLFWKHGHFLELKNWLKRYWFNQ